MKFNKSVVVIIVVILLITTVIFVFSENVHEEPNEFGSWGTQVTFNFEDGTSEILPSPLNIFESNGKQVKSITYKLSSKYCY